MKTLLKLTVLGALTIGLAVSCTPPTDPERETLDVPTGLAASNETDTSATLTWDKVEGASRYRVRIDEGEPSVVASTTYIAKKLDPRTEYTWSVQAFNGDSESEWSENATFTTVPATLEVPTNLVADPADISAILSWDAVEGATGYELIINDEDTFTSTTNNVEVTGLVYSTEYTWTVRATEGGRSGDWADETTFTTKPVQFAEIYLDNDFGRFLYPEGIRNLYVSFHSWHEGFGVSGYDLTLDLLLPEGEAGDGILDSDKRYVIFPATTYNVEAGQTPNLILPGAGSYVQHYVNGVRDDEIPKVVGGTMVVERGGSDERIVFELELDNGEIFSAEWNGQIILKNPYYETPLQDHDFGTFTGICEFVFVRNPYGDSKDVWGISAYDGDIWIESDKFMGNGTILRLFIYFPDGSDDTVLPDGEYPLIGDPVAHTPGMAFAKVSFIENNRWFEEDDISIASGTVKTVYSEELGEYTITIDDGKTARGENIKIAVQGYESTMQ